MKNSLIVSTILLLSMFVVSIAQQAGIAAMAQQQASTIDDRQMPFLQQMRTRLVEYNQTGNWTKKIFPIDEPNLDVANSTLDLSNGTLYVEVFVLDVVDSLQFSRDIKTGKIEHSFQVYTASESVVKQLSEIPNTYFYVFKYRPAIGMIVEKQVLQQVASNPSVYCIRIIPQVASDICSSA